MPGKSDNAALRTLAEVFRGEAGLKEEGMEGEFKGYILGQSGEKRNPNTFPDIRPNQREAACFA